MPKSSQEQIQSFKKILVKCKTKDPAKNPGIEQIISMIQSLIRKNEVRLILDRYLKLNCNFGYFTLLSQIIEEQVRDLIRISESILEHENRVYKPIAKIDKLPLGTLIQKLETYFKYNHLIELLNKFNDLRISVIHHLIDDFSKELIDIELEIVDHHLTGTYDAISNKIFETNRRLNERLRLTTYKNTSYPKFVLNLSNQMNALLQLSGDEIIFKFNNFPIKTP